MTEWPLNEDRSSRPDNPDRVTRPRYVELLRYGGVTGALVAAAVCAATALVPVAVRVAFVAASENRQPEPLPPLASAQSPFLTWSCVIVLYLLVQAAIAALGGAATGVLVARIDRPLVGSLVGTSVFSGLCLPWVLGVPRYEPNTETINGLISAATIGYVSGGAVVLLRRRRDADPARPERSASRLRIFLLLLPALVLFVAWQTYLFRHTQASRQIERAGGMVTWDAVSEPKAYWRVDFRSRPVKDATVEELIPYLARFHPLDLHLEGSPITDEALGHLASLSNLARIHLHGTHVTEDGVARLRRALPGLEVDR